MRQMKAKVFFPAGEDLPRALGREASTKWQDRRINGWPRLRRSCFATTIHVTSAVRATWNGRFACPGETGTGRRVKRGWLALIVIPPRSRYTRHSAARPNSSLLVPRILMFLMSRSSVLKIVASNGLMCLQWFCTTIKVEKDRTDRYSDRFDSIKYGDRSSL